MAESSRRSMDSRLTSRKQLDLADVYLLSDPLQDRVLRAEVAAIKLRRREDDLDILRGRLSVEEPVQARWAMGGAKASDLVWATEIWPLFINERVEALLQEHGFTGWGTYPVELRGKSGEPIPGYRGLSIHGRCGKIRHRRSSTVTVQYPARKARRRKGLFFDPDSWDGSDIFLPSSGELFKFVVGDVKRAFEKAKIRNVYFEATTETLYDR